jgi:hypothetical protein
MPLYGCRSGSHTWITAADAAKCCNGWRRELVIEQPGVSLDDCDHVVSERLPGGWRYGWVR